MSLGLALKLVLVTESLKNFLISLGLLTPV